MLTKHIASTDTLSQHDDDDNDNDMYRTSMVIMVRLELNKQWTKTMTVHYVDNDNAAEGDMIELTANLFLRSLERSSIISKPTLTTPYMLLAGCRTAAVEWDNAIMCEAAGSTAKCKLSL